MAILPIFTYPDPVLKHKSLEVEEVDSNLRKLMDNMLKTMYHDNGVGLAAVQVGVLKRIIVMDLQNDDEVARPEGFYPLYLVNPELTFASEEKTSAKEACLSVPEQQVDVTRAENIKVKFTDYHNKPCELEASGWLARVIQHEMDHLEGKLLIDHLSILKKDIAIRKLKKLKKHSM